MKYGSYKGLREQYCIQVIYTETHQL